MQPDLAFKAATGDRPTNEEMEFAGKIGLPSASEWLLAFGAEARRPDAARLDRARIASAGGFRTDADAERAGAEDAACVERVSHRAKLLAVADNLRARGLSDGEREALVRNGVAALYDPRNFMVCASHGDDADAAALLHVRRSVLVEASQEDGEIGVDYELEVVGAVAAGEASVLADAACHAALARQLEADMAALGRGLQACGYEGEVLCNVYCADEAMRGRSLRVADLLRGRQDALRAAVGGDPKGFSDFRDPSVLDV